MLWGLATYTLLSVDQSARHLSFFQPKSEHIHTNMMAIHVLMTGTPGLADALTHQHRVRKVYACPNARRIIL